MLQIVPRVHIKKVVLNGWFWLAFSVLMFALPLYKSVVRELPPEIPKIYQISDFSLLDENGLVFNWSSLRGRFVLVNFHFTRCPSICREVMLKTQEIQKRVRGLGNKVAIVSISVDPEFDQPEILKTYAANLKSNPMVWKFLTGEKKDIEKVVMDNFRTSLQRADADANIFDIAHSGSIFLIDDQGWLRSTYGLKKYEIDRLMIDLGLMVNRLFYKQ